MIPALIPALAPLLGKVVGNVFPDPEAKAKAEAELMKMANSHEMQQLHHEMSAIVMEAKSKDPFTSRARPSLFYVMYGVIVLCFIGGILGVWWPTEVYQAADNIASLLAAIPEELWWLFTTGYLGYTGARTYEKKQIVQKGK